MIFLGMLLSAALPLLAGVPWVWSMGRDNAPGAWPLTLAYGYVLGLLIAILSMRALDLVGVPANFFTIAALPLAAAAIGWRRARGGFASARNACEGSLVAWRAMNRMDRIVLIAVVGLVALRLLTLGAEIVFRPIFPWEAVSAVAVKARVWFDLGSIAQFVPPAKVLEGLGSYTDADPDAFALPSLLLVFTAHMMTQWHEGAVAFPWWMMGLAMVLAVYGHLRRSGAGIAFSLCFAYIFVSLPLVDLHIGLAGAPQWIAATGVGLAGCAMLRWLDTRERQALLWVAIGAALALMTLASTWPWFVIFILSAAMTRWPRLSNKLAIGLPLLLLLALLGWQQTPIKVRGATYALQVVPTWSETIESLFLLDNWHLLYGAAILVAIFGWRMVATPRWLARTWLVGMGGAMLLVWGVVSVPGLWFGGLRDFSYAALQFAAILVVWTGLVARAIAVNQSEKKTAATAPATSIPGDAPVPEAPDRTV